MKQRSEKKLLIETEEGLTTNEEERVKIIANNFHTALNNEAAEEIHHIPPIEMKNPFNIT